MQYLVHKNKGMEYVDFINLKRNTYGTFLNGEKIILSDKEKSEYDYLRFWSKVNVTANDDLCWEWQAYLNKNGYGAFGINGKSYLSNRVAFEYSNGYLDKDICVLHKCDNRKCCNPKHLFLGTRVDNNNDKVRKGRAQRLFGDINPNSKVTEKDILPIKELINSGLTYTEVGRRYNISKVQARNIYKGRSWRHLNMDTHD